MAIVTCAKCKNKMDLPASLQGKVKWCPKCEEEINNAPVVVPKNEKMKTKEK